MEVGVANKHAKIDETIRRLFEALLFNQASETSNNHVFISIKSFVVSSQRERASSFFLILFLSFDWDLTYGYFYFEDGKSSYASQLVKLEFSQV